PSTRRVEWLLGARLPIGGGGRCLRQLLYEARHSLIGFFQDYGAGNRVFFLHSTLFWSDLRFFLCAEFFIQLRDQRCYLFAVGYVDIFTSELQLGCSLLLRLFYLLLQTLQLFRCIDQATNNFRRHGFIAQCKPILATGIRVAKVDVLQFANTFYTQRKTKIQIDQSRINKGGWRFNEIRNLSGWNTSPA